MPKIPKLMTAAVIDRFGPPGVIKIRQLPVPEIGPGEVLIALHSAGVGPWDADIRGGWSPTGKPPDFPLVLGADGAGVIAAVGSRVRRLRVGDRVYSFGWNFPKNGFYAEYVAVAADVTAKIPGRLDMLQAGAVPITALTALRGIDDILNLKRGETIIVHGASGGVGNMALQFAKLRGARVLATASGNDGVKLVRKLGADAAVEGHSKDITSAARQFAPHGVDAIFAAAGGAALTQCLDALRPGGRIAYPNGVEPEPKKRPKIKRTSYDAVAGRRSFEQLARAFKSAKIQVPIAAIFPLARAAEAHRQLAKGHVLGKIVLRIR